MVNGFLEFITLGAHAIVIFMWIGKSKSMIIFICFSLVGNDISDDLAVVIVKEIEEFEQSGIMVFERGFQIVFDVILLRTVCFPFCIL